MIGVVVVTHGQLATELVNAAEMIVGDLPQFTAVSIGWHEDVNDAREDIAQAIERVRGRVGRADADRHVRRHAVESRHDVSRDRRHRGDHRRESADADQAGVARADRATCWRSRARCATTAGTPSGSRRTCCAAKQERHDLADGHRREPAGHARAGGGEVRPPGGALQVARRVGAARARDGRQEHHGTAAARRGARHDDHDRGRRRRRAGGRRGARGAGRNPDSARTHATPDRHRRVARRGRAAARSS